MTLRVGVTGTENSHADAVVAYLNRDRCQDAGRVTALAGGPSARNRQLAELGDIATIVDEPGDLLGHVDAVIVCDRDGRRHRAAAQPFLTAGLPVFVDKPFTCGTTDAHALVELAARHRALLSSYSPLRYAAEVDALAARVAELPSPYTVEVRGPADPASEYGGIYYYGSHHADIALRLAPGGIGDVRVRPDEDGGWVATASVGGHRVVLRFEPPARSGGFRVAIPELPARTGIPIDERFFRPGLDMFFQAVTTRVAPIAPHDLVRPVHLLDAIAARICPDHGSDPGRATRSRVIERPGPQ